MSFRTNLQYLRAERHMTQEQLAMLLGVSRQSVTKWEAEKSYPEMDKLIKMCQIFECSLDDLVQGDVSRHGVPSRDDLGGYSPVRVATDGGVGDMSAGPLLLAGACGHGGRRWRYVRWSVDRRTAGCISW